MSLPGLSLQGWERPPAGTGIAVVAPAGYARDQAALEIALAALAAQGCRVRNYYDPGRKHQRFGATDADRVAQLHAAARDPDVRIVLSLRGGYGMTRLLPDIDFDLLAASGKLFVGHSDFTALQMGLLARTGAISFAGPMICDDFTRDDISGYTMEAFWQCLSHPSCSVAGEAAGNPRVEAAGTLWGGNLTMLTHLLGTPYFPAIDGGILFVEDINEHPYRVERMLLQLLHAGVLARQSALLLGDFSGYRLSEYDNGYDFAAMLGYLRGALPLPVLAGLPFGHVRDKATLAVGCQARLSGAGPDFRLEMRSYPILG
ncbi:MAG: muramoyltetrapeptide carboxypeptidase [Noviherbaspirillum sp.]